MSGTEHETERPTLNAIRANRRTFLTGAGLAIASGFAANLPSRAHAITAPSSASRRYPFTLGIASGDPTPDGVVIWTRLAPSPYEIGGGLDGRAHPVQWQVATDSSFAQVLREGTARAHPEYSHSVHVDVGGLQAGRDYYYRFRSGTHLSETGRTRTAPQLGAHLTGLNLVVASCQSLGGGFYHAWKDAATDPADAVLFLGDYIYEYAVDATSVRWPYTPPLPDDFQRQTDTLDRYRQQYSLHKSDPDLIEAHRLSPWIVTWDDHEVVNDYDSTDEQLMTRRANAYRAYWEHMPLRLSQLPSGPDARLYRRLTYGNLAQFNVLDTRQYRSPSLPGSRTLDTPERRDPSRTMLGTAQEAWLLDGLSASSARWNVLANSVLFGRLDSDPSDGQSYSTGGWDGYQASQQKIIQHVTDQTVDNFVVLTGDVHRNYDLDILADYDTPGSATVGVEFAGTSISSGRDGQDSDAGVQDRYAANPHLKFANLQRGYLRCRVDHESWTTELRVLDRVSTPEYSVSTRKTLMTEAGNPGLVEV
ncbi:MAG: alkaline phosphatase D family protein [Nocardioidaceae bacterium]|nr:alkaline phosphatase D family protein [Nocardioidaceae bacterium]